MRRWGLALAAVMGGALVAAVLSRPAVDACGPHFTPPTFVSLHRPDLPYERFVAGQLGTLRPTYARRYLAVAYRNLAGVPFSQAAQAAQVGWNAVPPSIFSGPDAALWLEARRRFGAPPIPDAPDPYRPVGSKDSYTRYANCLTDAFRTAASTLASRVEVYGAKSAEVAEWLRGQDQVFANCGGGRVIPSSAPASLPRLIHDDRAYQIAAAFFYAADFDTAERLFHDIAANDGSPWRSIAPYLAVRCQVRKATLALKSGFDRTLLERAAAGLEELLRSPDSTTRSRAQGLETFVADRLDPVGRVRTLSQQLMSEQDVDRLDWQLSELTTVLDRLHGEDLMEGREGAIERARTGFGRLQDVRAAGDLADWIITFQDESDEAADHATRRWRETKSVPWLLAALVKASAGTADVERLIADTAAVPRGSPAHPTLTVHRIRLEYAMGRTDLARAELDSALQEGASWPASTVNELLSMRMQLAHGFEEMLRLAPRRPIEGVDPLAAGSFGTRLKDAKPYAAASFDVDAAALLNNRLGLERLLEASRHRAIPPHLQQDIAISAWTRAVLLDDDATARRAFEGVAARLGDQLKSEVNAYRTASTRPDRQRAALFLLLKTPGLRPFVASGGGRWTALDRIDQIRDNWWCEGGTPAGMSNYGGLAIPDVPWPPFLEGAELARARRELQRIAKLPAGPVDLSRRAVTWAKANPDDPRVPEALHLAVRATRYGCATSETTPASRAAFTLLHQRYPKSEWATRTKYYY